MKLSKISILISIFILIAFVVAYSAGWLIFHKPEYKGRIIDAETKEPIDGAVVVAMYNIYPIISGPAGSSASIIHIKEALTNEKGEFVIPSYWSIMGPNNIEDFTKFIIYKPGYGSFPNNGGDIYPFQYCDPSYLFSKKIDVKREVHSGADIVKITFGVAQLHRLKTRGEMLKAMPSPPSEWENKVPLLLNAINEERKSFGLKLIGPGRD